MTRTSSSSTTDARAEVVASASSAPAPRSFRAASLLRLTGEKVLGAVIVLFGAATATFLAQLALPGDRATTILNIRTGQIQARTANELAPISAEYGLNDPVLVQYFEYLGGLLRGDLGTSYQQHRPVLEIIGDQIGATLTLTIAAIILAWVLMVVWVTLTAGRSRRIRALGSTVDTITAGLPPYWVGIILLLVFALGLGWFPVIGGTGIGGLVLPSLTLAIPLAGFMGQATRTEFERSLAQPFVVTARMRGMSDLGIRLRHVLRHAVLPAITLSGWAIGATISGAVIVETVFTRPGIGRVLISAVDSQDLPVVTGVVILVAALYVLANLLVDAAYIVIDPRLKQS